MCDSFTSQTHWARVHDACITERVTSNNENEWALSIDGGKYHNAAAAERYEKAINFHDFLAQLFAVSVSHALFIDLKFILLSKMHLWTD